MGRVRMTFVLVSATALLALCAPAIALGAGSYTWSLPGDFTTSAPGANPEHKYELPSWSYYGGSPATSLTRLPDFSSNFNGGLHGWSDNPASPSEYIATDSSGTLVMDPPVSGSVTVGWASPFSTSQTVTVTESVSVNGGVTCLDSSRLTDQGGNSVTTGTPVTLPPGGAIYLTLTGGVTALTTCSADVTLQITAPATVPTVTLTSPTNGSMITNGQPDFVGRASTGFGFANSVTVNVYAGASTSGTPVQTLTTTPTPNGSFAVVPSTALANGQYTAVAQQDDLLGDVGSSAPVTFTVNNTGPSLTLHSLGSKPLLTATPTFTGTGGTLAQGNSSVVLAIYSGVGISGSPVRRMTGSLGSNGAFSIQVSPALADGRYTAVVLQAGGGMLGFSSSVIFTIKVHPPAVTLGDPPAGASIPRASVAFSGRAGSELGDAPTIAVYLYRGDKAGRKAVGRFDVHAHGSSWSGVWPHQLRDGRYTVRAVQTDDAGHTARTASHTFLVVTGPTTVGAYVYLSRSRIATVPISCLAPLGTTCTGTVLVVTTRSFRPTPGGPSGRLRVLFSYVRIAGGRTEIVRGSVPGGVAAVLRRASSVAVRVTTALSRSGGPVGTLSAHRALKLK